MAQAVGLLHGHVLPFGSHDEGAGMWSWLPLLIPAAILVVLAALLYILAPFALAAWLRRPPQLQALAEELGMEYAASDDTGTVGKSAP